MYNFDKSKKFSQPLMQAKVAIVLLKGVWSEETLSLAFTTRYVSNNDRMHYVKLFCFSNSEYQRC